MFEDQAVLDLGISHVALAGPDPEPTHNEFMADLYPKNLEDAYAIWDQFINDKSTYDEPGKLNVEAELVSMETVPIYQASSSVPPLSTLVYTLKLRDLAHKNNEAVCENVKEAIQIALQAPFRDRFRDLSEEDMKEMLHQRMFETGSYKSLPEHIALYEALEASMERAQRDEFPAEKDKSQKRRCDYQDPPPPPPDSDQNAPSSSSKQQPGPHAKQPVDDIPIQDSDNIFDSEDTDFAYLPKTKQRPEWLKPIPDDKRPATPKPAWVIPTSHIPDAVNNWANDLATTYQALAENSLLEKTRDMRTFMNWYCQKMGKTELTQAGLEGQAYEVVKTFYPNVVHFQFQMEECHKMLTDQINWANPEGDQVRIDISKPLPLSGPPGHGSGQALSISKMKAARYHDFGLKLLVPEHMWIDDTRNLVIRQRVEDFQLGIESYQKQMNLTKPGWDATGFEFKHDYTIIDSPYAVVFPVSNNERKIMRFNEIYMFSDGTLTNIMEALDYKVKEYKVNRLNPGMNTRVLGLIRMWKGARNSYMPLNGDSRPEGSSEI
ncbi:hypothetical protein Tco_0092668 [Tanacetum coccineum]